MATGESGVLEKFTALELDRLAFDGVLRWPFADATRDLLDMRELFLLNGKVDRSGTLSAMEE